jgi:anti-sigma factor RsiW
MKSGPGFEAIMSDCQFNSRLNAYHDGELDAGELDAVAAHLESCDSCRKELAGIVDVSRAMEQFDPGEITPIELGRLHRELDRADESGLIRFTAVLATMAASVLVISLAWIGQASQPSTPTASLRRIEQLPEWQRLAMGEPATPPYLPNQGVPSIPNTGVAIDEEKGTIDWMLNGLQSPVVHESR